jgi:serine/threonine protein kinase
MALVRDFKATVMEHYPDFTLSTLDSTKHENVMRLSKDGTHYIAKSIWFDSTDPEDESRAQLAFETEVAVLKQLPPSWNLHYVDSFVSRSGWNRIIVTTEVPSCSWADLKPRHYNTVARSLQRQIKWLHAHDIVHGDLELKNILLSCDQQSATIIDFEKSTRSATKEETTADVTRLLAAVKDKIPPFWRPLSEVLRGRRASMGGTRRRKRATRRIMS